MENQWIWKTLVLVKRKTRDFLLQMWIVLIQGIILVWLLTVWIQIVKVLKWKLLVCTIESIDSIIPFLPFCITMSCAWHNFKQSVLWTLSRYQPNFIFSIYGVSKQIVFIFSMKTLVFIKKNKTYNLSIQLQLQWQTKKCKALKWEIWKVGKFFWKLGKICWYNFPDKIPWASDIWYYKTCIWCQLHVWFSCHGNHKIQNGKPWNKRILEIACRQ